MDVGVDRFSTALVGQYKVAKASKCGGLRLPLGHDLPWHFPRLDYRLTSLDLDGDFLLE